MDATNSRTRVRHRRGHRHRRHGRHRRSTSPTPSSSPNRLKETLRNVRASVENKMGLPPPYEQTISNPAPPPSYFGDNPPPPPGLVVPPNTTPRTTVITSPQPASRPAMKLGPGPTGVACQTCNKTVVTRVDYVPNNRTHIISAALCVIASCCCGCLFPYCMRSCKTANHYCPQCRGFIGSYTPS